MKEVSFEEVGVNTVFMLRTLKELMWCSKIDDSRYVRIGNSGSYHIEDGDVVFVEAT